MAYVLCVNSSAPDIEIFVKILILIVIFYARTLDVGRAN